MTKNQNQSQIQPQIVYFDKYKTYDGFKYINEFPDGWLLNEMAGTGRQCNNCHEYATWRGCFIGYCANCAREYFGERCKGFNGYGVEWFGHPNYESAYDSYLRNFDFDNFGQLEDNPDHTIEKHNLFRRSSTKTESKAADRDTDDDYEEDYKILEKKMLILKVMLYAISSK